MSWYNRRSRLQAAITAWRNKIAQERAAAEAEAARIAEEKRIAAEAEAQRIADAAQAAAEAKAVEAKAAADSAAAAVAAASQGKADLTGSVFTGKVELDGGVELPAGTSDPSSPTQATTYFNTNENSLKIYGSNNDWGSVVFSPLGSQQNPATSGYALYQSDSTLPTGYYWIQNDNMPQPVQMWVDMQYGGYDFYAFQGNGTSVTYANQSHSGTPMGLDIVYPRSPNHWRAMSNYVRNATGNSPLSGSYSSYFQIVYGVHKTSGGGNYTGNIFRHTDYGSGSSAHRVNDGGRWWVRNVTHSEPNGDYTAYAWFGLQAGGYTFPNPYNGENIFFNDGNANYSTGGYYLVSTNAKPD